MGIQEFTYKIQLYPNTTTTTVTSEGTAFVIFMDDIETDEGVCRDGKPAALENLTPTDER